MEFYILALSLLSFGIGFMLLLCGYFAGKLPVVAVGIFLLFGSTTFGGHSYLMASELSPAQYKEVAAISDPRFKRIVLSKMSNGSLTYGNLLKAREEFGRLEAKKAKASIASWSNN